MDTITIVLVVAVALVALWLIAAFNALVRLRNRSREAWSDIDVQTKRRYDLIPNLIETVKGYAAHEAKVLEAVTAARAKAMGATGDAKAEAENMLSGTLKSLFALSESYPTLKANENYLLLQNQLKELEDTIEHARRYYNAVVRDFNTLIESVPYNIVAGAFGFKQAEFFGLSNAEAEREPVKVRM